jgi:SpoIID/LytB domain protein
MLAACPALLLLFAALPARAAVYAPDVRVLLSLGKEQTISFTPVGTFGLQGYPDTAVGNEPLAVSAVGKRVSVDIGGKTITAASLTFLCGEYGGRLDYIRLKNAAHGTCTYLGNMTFDVYEGAVRGINTLPLEQYLYGVVPHEMSNRFPVDAQKAQAVCARGFAVARSSKNLSRAYDISDTSQDQVYRGYASANRRAIAAVDATRGQVLTYDGDIVETYYSASNGGQTEKTGNVWSVDFPYYVNADDPYDLANDSSIEEKSFIPQQYTETTRKLMDPFVLLALQRAANKAAGRETRLLGTVQVTPKTPSYAAPSRAFTEADVVLLVEGALGGGQTGQVTITLKLDELKFGGYENMLGRLGAGKTRLRLRGAERGSYYHDGIAYPGWYFTERRYGHGVGLSQRGAQERARAGQSYTDILAFYYVNTALYTVGTYDTAPAITSEVYRVRNWGVSGIPAGAAPGDVLGNLSSKGGLSIVNSKGNVIAGNVIAGNAVTGNAAGGSVRTGYFVRVEYDGGTSFFDLPIVVYGDVDGDGEIAYGDVTALQNHLLRAAPLGGAYLRAADINHDGDVDAYDMGILIRAINGDAGISQGG